LNPDAKNSLPEAVGMNNWLHQDRESAVDRLR
jgi:hypothetical protein